MPLIEVVIPCYNYGHYLPECIASIAGQSVTDWRAVIIDDASPDGSAAVAHRLAAEDGRIAVIAHERNQGHIATYNEGIAQATGELFLLLSADDMLAPGALERATACLRRHPGVVLTWGGSVDFDDAPPRLPPAESSWTVQPGANLISALCARAVDFVPTPSVILRTAAQQQAGPYRAALPHSGDLEMWLRVATLGDVAKTAAVQSLKRVHGRNMSLTDSNVILRDYEQRQAAYASFFADVGGAMEHGPRLHRLARQKLALRACRTGLAQAVRGHRGTAAALLRFAGRVATA